MITRRGCHGNQWIRLEGNAIVSAVKWAEDGQGLVIRIFNAESNVSPVRLKPAKQPIRAIYTNLIEENQSEMKITNQALRISSFIRRNKDHQIVFIIRLLIL